MVEAVMVAVVVERVNARAKATATDVCVTLCTHMPSSRDGDQRTTWRRSTGLEEEHGPQGARTKVGLAGGNEVKVCALP